MAHATPSYTQCSMCYVDQVRIMAFALANTRAARRESYLSHLHRFSSASKAQLCHSDVDSDLLFNLASMEKAIGQAQQAASVSLTEAAAKVLIKVKPRLGTLLVEKHPCSSTSADSRPRPGPTQQRFSKPHFHPRTSHDSGHPSSRQSKIQTFWKCFPSQTSSVGGCLAQHLPTWEDIGAEEWVLWVLCKGYKIPFHSFPLVFRVP
ncbi:hypothetical protein E2C01_004734 [Portunus trituberculatus]|uniref:Uncharacterized protein n=1 Tax=Portunus trituberculatus TaxID=210409 RepID=A0A5B7CSG4_PORTR|nr:hypothetical protein [Portunus trituberculatus]